MRLVLVRVLGNDSVRLVDGTMPWSVVLKEVMRADVVLWNYCTFDGLLGAIAMKKRAIIVYHNVTPPEFFLHTAPLVALRSVVSTLQIRLLPASWKYVGVSEFNVMCLRRLGKGHATVLPFLLKRPLALHAAKATGPTVIFVGRIVESKNVIELVRCVEMCGRKVNQRIALTVIGTGRRRRRYYKQFDAEIKRLATSESVMVTWIQSPVTDDELLLHMASSWLYASASQHEGVGLPVCEAIQGGTPAVYLECGGTESVLSGVGAMRSPEELTAAMANYLSNRQARDALMQAQRRIVSLFEMSGGGERKFVDAFNALAESSP